MRLPIKMIQFIECQTWKLVMVGCSRFPPPCSKMAKATKAAGVYIGQLASNSKGCVEDREM